jgi:hypothetical protein
MTTNNKVAATAKARAEFVDADIKNGDVFTVNKNKKMQADNSVSNVYAFTDKRNKMKYNISVSVGANPLEDDSTPSAEHLAMLQDVVTNFLNGIENNLK